MTLKYCRGCDKERDVSEFWAHPEKRDGLQTLCKECQRAAHRADYRKYRDRRLAYQREYDARKGMAKA